MIGHILAGKEVQPAARAPIILVALALAAGILLAVLLDSSWAVALFLTLLVALLLALPVLWLLSGRGGNIIQPITVFSMTALGYVLGALHLLSGNQSQALPIFLNPASFPAFNHTLLVIVAGVLCFQAGYYLPLARDRLSPARAGGRERWTFATHLHWRASYSRLLRAIALTALFGLIGYLLFIHSSGGLSYLLAHIGQRTLLRTTDYYRFIFQFTQAASFVWYAYDRRALRRPAFWLLFAGNLAGLVTLGSAAPVILYVGYLIVYHFLVYARYRITFVTLWRNLPVILLVLALVFVALAGRVAWRDASARAAYQGDGRLHPGLILESLNAKTRDGQLAQLVFGGANLASIEQLHRIVRDVPGATPFTYGRTFAWVLIAPIPRVLWPDKPAVSVGIYLKQALENTDAQTGGVPSSWLGELYLNGGILAVILGCLAFGYLSALVVLWYRRRRNHPLAHLLYLNYTVIFVFYLTKADLQTALIRSLAYVAAFLLAYYLLGRLRGRVVGVSGSWRDRVPSRQRTRTRQV